MKIAIDMTNIDSKQRGLWVYDTYIANRIWLEIGMTQAVGNVIQLSHNKVSLIKIKKKIELGILNKKQKQN